MYWPNQQSVILNSEVAKLFIQTYNKFFFNLQNRTKHNLALDILHPSKKIELLLFCLIEFEIIILDIIELNLSVIDIKQLSNQILYDLIYKTTTKFIKNKSNSSTKITINLRYNHNQIFFSEHNNLYKNLIIYLVFGSKYINKQIFKFNQNRTPKYHIKILFEHFIIQISNIVLLNLLNNKKQLKELFSFKKININDFHYQSIRDLLNFQNNLFSYYWIQSYIYYPQNIYCNQYQVWLFSSKGLIYKYIYANRYLDYLTLCPSRMNAIIYLEIQDFIIPKFNFLISLLGKLIIYVLIEIISKSLQILLNQIIIRFNNNKE